MRIYRKNEREQCQQCCQFKSSFSKILLEKKKKKWYDGYSLQYLKIIKIYKERFRFIEKSSNLILI